jgi:hypothetical protein
MNLPELIENLHLDLDQLNRNVINQEIVANYSDQDLDRLILIFLRGIGSLHSVPGNTVYSLADMSQRFRKFAEYSPKQRVYIIQNILENWHQLGLDMRCQLSL